MKKKGDRETKERMESRTGNQRKNGKQNGKLKIIRKTAERESKYGKGKQNGKLKMKRKQKGKLKRKTNQNEKIKIKMKA